ncbi:MAG TPA: hypothetical protein VNV87_04745 [Acidimicrobiales bacterium]|nr:hypothetical protein [Acidimicrobiales bacterium]
MSGHGVVFAVAAPCLQRHRALAVVAGLAVPAGFLAVVRAGLALSHVATRTPVFADSAGLAQWTRSTLEEWAVTAPAGGLLARRVLYGRHIPPKDRAE